MLSVDARVQLDRRVGRNCWKSFNNKENKIKIIGLFSPSSKKLGSETKKENKNRSSNVASERRAPARACEDSRAIWFWKREIQIIFLKDIASFMKPETEAWHYSISNARCSSFRFYK